MGNEEADLHSAALAGAEEDLDAPVYSTAYRSLRLTRCLGVLVAEFHSNGSLLPFTAPDHTDLSRPFTGFSGSGEHDYDPDGCRRNSSRRSTFLRRRCCRPGCLEPGSRRRPQILENIANIRVPMIAAVEGRAHVHSEYALLANVIVAGKGATFNVCRISQGASARRSNLTAWSYRAGAGRAEASSRPAAADGAYRARWGVVAEVVRR